MKQMMLVLLPLAFLCGIACASDAYFVRFNAEGRQAASGASVLWVDEIVFYNAGTAPAVVRFLGVSNGTARTDVPELTLTPGQVVLLNPTLPLAEKWLPAPVPLMWVLHLDIPDAVVVESRDEFYLNVNVPEAPSPPLGKVSMPVFKQLVAAGQPQVHLGTDLRRTRLSRERGRV